MEHGNAMTITPELIQHWQDELAEVNSEVATLRERAVGLERKIEAATFLLLPTAALMVEHIVPKGTLNAANLSLVDKITNATIGAGGALLTPKQIKDVLIKQGQYPDGSSANYFYSALKRACDRGAIHSEGGKYYAKSEG